MDRGGNADPPNRNAGDDIIERLRAWVLGQPLNDGHEPRECGVAYASFKGCGSSVRHLPAIASCAFGGHAIWWTVYARDAQAALSDLPFFVAQRSSATQVAEVVVP